MSRIRNLVLCVIVTSSPAILFSPSFVLADDCDNITKFMRPNPGGNPVHLRWIQGAQIPLGCMNCSEVENNIIAEAISKWASISGGKYSFTSGNNMYWKAAPWGNEHDLMQMNILTQPTVGEPYLTSVSVEFDDSRTDFWYSESDCPPTLGGLGKYDFYSAVLHEVGHVLGLGHANCTGEVMHEILNNRECRRLLGDVDIEAIDYLYCASCQFAAASGAAGCGNDACTPDNPVAKIAGFNFLDGFAMWRTLEEVGTAYYVIEGCNSVDGLGTDLTTEPSGVGVHKVAVVPGSYSLLRLVEVEEVGNRFVRGIARAGDYSPVRPTRLFPDTDLASSRAFAPKPPQERASSATPPTVLIYTKPDLWGAVWDNVLWAWDHHLWEWEHRDTPAVDIVEIPDDPPGALTPQEWIKADIASRYASQGTRRFHLVGDWRGEYPSITANARRAPDAPTSEWIYSDQWYADVDADTVPDVVVTRWPANNENEVVVMAANNWLYLSGLAASPIPDDATFLVGDLDEQSGSGSLARWMSEQVEAIVPLANPYSPGGFTHSRILVTSFPDVDDRNAETASLLNDRHPDLISILSTSSGQTNPGRFFTVSIFGVPAQNPWTMSMLEPGWFVRMVIAASCGTAYWLADDTVPPPAGPSVAEKFFTAYNRGAVAWIGPDGPSLQDANYVVSRYIVEELMRNPYRPMAEAWLEAMQRAYEVFAASPEFLPTLKRYYFLGDPVSPFSRLPSSETSSRVRHINGTEAAMPTAFALGCPQGDNVEKIVVEVTLDATDVLAALNADALTLSQPANGSVVFFPDEAPIVADSATALVPQSNEHRTTFTIDSFSGCGVDSALVSLYGLPLGYAKVKVRTPDFAPPFCAIDIVDFAYFVNGYPVVPAVDDCRDFNNDGQVSTVDWSFFSTHYLNHYGQNCSGGNAPAEVASSNASVALRLTEEYPTATTHRLYVDVDVENFAGVTTSLFSIGRDNERLTFVEWLPSANSPGTILFASKVRDGVEHLVVGMAASEPLTRSTVSLGKLVFDVTGSQPFELSNDEFALMTGEVLLEEAGGQSVAARMSGFMGRTLDPAVVRIYHNRLEQNFPNPFNPSTTLAFSLKDGGNVSLTIYDVAGRRVRELVNERRDRGAYKVTWDGQNDAGQIVASGVYFYKLIAGSFTDTKKMTILK